MTRTAVRDLLADPLGYIEDPLESKLPDPIEALEAEYEIALGRLIAYFPRGTSSKLSERAQRLSRRVAHHFLFNYYMGFMIMKFRPAYRDRGTPTARQLAIEEAIQSLARLEPARALMAEWFTAALEQRLHETIRRYFDAYKFTLHPTLAIGRTAARIVLTKDTETFGTYSEEVFKVLEFGLSGFYLLFKSTNAVQPTEFETLLDYSRQAMHPKRVEANIPHALDVVRVLSAPSLTFDQREELAASALSLLDFERFPWRNPYEDIEDLEARGDAVIEDMGFSRPLTRMIKFVFRRLDSWLGRGRGSHDYYRELHPNPEQEATAYRRSLVAAMLGVVAVRSDQPALALERYAIPFAQSTGLLVPEARDALIDESLTEGLISSLNQPTLMNLLAMRLGKERQAFLGDPVDHRLALEALEALRESDRFLDETSARILIDVIHQGGDREERVIWARRILENVPGLTFLAESYLAEVAQVEEDPAVLCALIGLHRNITQQSSSPSAGQELEEALFDHLKRQLFDSDLPIQLEWASWLLGLKPQYLLDLLKQIGNHLRWARSPSHVSRDLEVLRAIIRAAERIERPDAVTLATCWLVDLEDWLQTGQPLIERIKEAVQLLESTETSDFIQNRVADLLNQAISLTIQASPILRGESEVSYWDLNEALKVEARLVTIAKALRTMRNSELAFPFLERLLDLEPKPYAGGGWGLEYMNQRQALHSEAFISIAALNPLPSGAIQCMEKQLRATEEPNTWLNELTPDFIHDQVLPLLPHPVSPEAVAELIESVWRNHCPLCTSVFPLEAYEQPSFKLYVTEKAHRYLCSFNREGLYADDAYGKTLLCTLQALANVTDLSLLQQRLIWRVYRTSWNGLTKSLCLLILGRQRPVREETIRTLIDTLRQNPSVTLFKIAIQSLFRSIFFRLFHHMSAPEPDLVYIYQCQTVAVYAGASLLIEQRYDPLVGKYKSRLEQALLAATSFFRYGIEPHLSGSRVSFGGAISGTKGVIRMMAASQEEAEQDLARPADHAYQVLKDLIEANALPSLREPVKTGHQPSVDAQG